MDSTETLAQEFLEISSEQRLRIILNLKERNSKISDMAKKLDATVPEVHRNFTRLTKSGFIQKNVDGTFSLTQYGQIVHAQIPSLVFLSKNKKFFQTHNFADLPTKFLQRIGALSNSQLINGYVKVLEKWAEIYKNSNQYIYNILVEVSYDLELTDTILKKLQSGVKIKSIFSDSAIVSRDRKKILEKKGFQKFITNEDIKRKMKKNIQILVVLNEKEAGICFPSDDEVDMSKMFYGKDEDFHDWCLDYFNDSWKDSGSFLESKLRE